MTRQAHSVSQGFSIDSPRITICQPQSYILHLHHAPTTPLRCNQPDHTYSYNPVRVTLLREPEFELTNSDNPEDVRQIYREWVSAYDTDLLQDQNALLYDTDCSTFLIKKLLCAIG